jgi:hypothetical protein
MSLGVVATWPRMASTASHRTALQFVFDNQILIYSHTNDKVSIAWPMDVPRTVAYMPSRPYLQAYMAGLAVPSVVVCLLGTRIAFPPLSGLSARF